MSKIYSQEELISLQERTKELYLEVFGINNQNADLLKENQELKARCQVHANMVGQLAEKLERKEALNAELLEALEEAVFMIQGYQVQHGEGPSNKKKLESLKSAINKAKAQ